MVSTVGLDWLQCFCIVVQLSLAPALNKIILATGHEMENAA